MGIDFLQRSLNKDPCLLWTRGPREKGERKELSVKRYFPVKMEDSASAEGPNREDLEGHLEST